MGKGTALSLPKCQREEFPGTVEQNIVIDRLPPVLVLSEDWHQAWKVGKFSDLYIKYSERSFKEKAALYEPLGCVANENGHFIFN